MTAAGHACWERDNSRVIGVSVISAVKGWESVANRNETLSPYIWGIFLGNECPL